MAHLTPISWRKFEKFLFFIGCELSRTKGDHRIYWRSDLQRPVVVPMEKDLPVFVIRNNPRVLGMSPEDYLDALKRI